MAEGKYIENPYIGPRTFEEADRAFFFGREREADALLSLVISERLVLFYAQSGAGKSSLINTSLRPALREEGFYLFPTGRVRGSLPKGIDTVDNIFVFNLLLEIDGTNPDASMLTQLTIMEFLKQHRQFSPSLGNDDEPLSRLIIVDQFEEILTTNLNRWPEREDFFIQIRDALADDPLLWVVFSIREDYVGGLAPYMPILPGRLRARFHMERMTHKVALDAIRKPAEHAGGPFAPRVAQQLVENLSQIWLSGQTQIVQGQYIEPVQLQVVCRQLWQDLMEKPGEDITEDDLRNLGDVDRAIAQFYESVIDDVAELSNVSGADLRSWFTDKLITRDGTRSLLYQGEHETGGLSNRAVELLSERYLLRAEIRAGGTWYELAHDRFIDPILHFTFWERLE